MSETIETVEAPVETEVAEQAVNTENAEPSEQVETQEKTFTQAELDSIIQKRIERERETTSKKAAQEARDAYIAEQNYEWNGKPIKTESEYKQAIQEKQLRDQYESQGLPDEVVQELVESKKFREQYENERKQNETTQKQQKEFQDFLEAYPDVKPDTIPQSVWDDVSKGRGLIDSYVRYENQTLKEKLSAIEKDREVAQQNEQNAASSTGSVTGQGDGKPTMFTREQVGNMSESEINRHWDAVQKSMKSWK